VNGLSLCELERAVALLERELVGARLDKLIQLDDARLVLCFRPASGERCHLLLCCEPGSARLSLLPEKPQAPRTPPAFAQYLRKQLGRASCSGLRLLGGDRQAVVSLRAGDSEWDLLLSILGPRSNLYVLDGEGILRESLRPLARTRRTLSRGEPWRNPDTPPPPPGEDRWRDVPDAGWFAAVEAHFGAAEGEARSDDLVRRLETALARQARGLARKLEVLRRDRQDAEGAEADRRSGELLKASLERVTRGAREVVLEDWDTGESITLPLDPRKSPQQNLEALFKRYRKRLRARDHLDAQIADLELQLSEHESLAVDFRALADAEPLDSESLARFAERPEPRRLLARYASRAPAAGPRASSGGPPARLRPRRYRSSPGLEIWVGRSDEGNDLLTTRLARGNDLFFHLDGSPGSHVVLRTQGRSDPPSESLLEAAELAVHFSRAKNAARADVHVAPIKQVSKPKGAKPGLVWVRGGRSLSLRREPERLARILAARIEDSDPG